MSDGYTKPITDETVVAMRLPPLDKESIATVPSTRFTPAVGKKDFDDSPTLTQFIKDNPDLCRLIEVNLGKQGHKFDAMDPSALTTAIRTVLVTAQHMQEDKKDRPEITMAQVKAELAVATAAPATAATTPVVAPPQDNKNLLHSIGASMLLNAKPGA